VKINSDRQAQYGLTLHVAEEADRSKARGNREIARIGSEITFDPKVLDTYHYSGWKSAHHDLLVICAAAEYADRRCARRIGQWARSFKLTIPVREPALWQRSEVTLSLIDTLRHLTGDDWDFAFTPSVAKDESFARQRSLDFGNSKQFVIAYSDGLDSRSVSGIHSVGDAAIRVRVTKNKGRIKSSEAPFDLIPFSVKVPSSPESSVRSRGFKFASVTAIAAQISNVKRIVVPESGQGALGPALLPLHNIYADYRNHPTFFRKMERFIRLALQYELSYEQPRLWHTKGQTIFEFISQPGQSAQSLSDTRSCWQQRWNTRSEGKLRQCGLCAACLLRRMSLHAAGVKETDDTYIFSDLSASKHKGSAQQTSRTMLEYGSVGARHLHQLANLAEVPDAQLRGHSYELARVLSIPEEETLLNLKRLLTQHSKEWREFVNSQGPASFLVRWTGGELYG
jgi:7-cyano-7-deazaguanine synthase in queuosine biosynthesis